jgi:hypothetical protein
VKKLVGLNLCATALAVVLAVGGGTAMASHGGGGGGGGGGTTPPATQPPASPPAPSGTWPTTYPLPLSPGTLLSQSSTKAVVRSTDTVGVVNSKLDNLYVTQKGCTERLAVNKPKDYLCRNAATGKTDEVWFTFAALDPTPTDASRSQSNAFLVKG